MLKIDVKQDCCGCAACASVCPKQCITMEMDMEGFRYPKVDVNQCVDCHICEKVCPIIHKQSVGEGSPLMYATYNKDERVREQSSSGGMFSLLASWVLERAGVVFGVGFGEGNAVQHKSCLNVNGLEELRGSKYVQSDTGTIFSAVKKVLADGKWVLFTGTPCQIQGLRAYLRGEYDRLITQDFICHGVASPKVWAKYLQEQERKQKAKVIGVSFRSKRKGWKKFSMELLFSNQKRYCKTLDKDAMLQFFLKDYSLRPSCYDCKFKEKKHISDFTLADFWGIEHIKPEMCDEKGVSLLFLNSEKAKSIFEELQPKMYFEAVEIEKVIPYNSAILYSVKAPARREEFFVDIHQKGINSVYRKYCLAPLPKRIINSLHLLLYKLKRKIKRRKEK